MVWLLNFRKRSPNFLSVRSAYTFQHRQKAIVITLLSCSMLATQQIFRRGKWPIIFLALVAPCLLAEEQGHIVAPQQPLNLSELVGAMRSTKSKLALILKDRDETEKTSHDDLAKNARSWLREHPAVLVPETHHSQSAMVELWELERGANATDASLLLSTEALGHALSLMENDYDLLLNEQDRWTHWEELARNRQAPPEILARILDLQNELRTAFNTLLPVRNQIIREQEEIGQLRFQIDRLKTEIGQRRIVIDHEVRSATGGFIWQSGLSRSELAQILTLLKSEISPKLTSIRPFWNENGTEIWLSFVGLTCLCFYSLTRARAKAPISHEDARNRTSELIQLLGSYRISASLCLALLLTGLLTPAAPAAFYDLINFALPLATLSLCAGLLGRSFRFTLIGFGIVFPPLLAWGALELLPSLDKWVLLGQSIIFLTCLTLDYQRKRWLIDLPEMPEWAYRLWTLLIIVPLCIGAIAITQGFVGVARINIWSSIVAVGDLLVYGSAACIAYTLIAGWLHSSLSKNSRILSQNHLSILTWLRRILTILVIGFIALDTLSNYGTYDTLMDGLKSMFEWQISVGGQSISLAQVTSALAVLLGTWISVKFLGLIMEEELFPRLTLPVGLPFAISSLVRYTVALMGFSMALGILGFDLNRVTLLAGALGVGIGFGLQNIFNNFASGLILLIERPMNVGDVIENGKLIGIVRRIGIRSSTIRTLQGAEVILPNAELIAKPVINWTLSDRLRRMELDLSTEAHASGVEPVIEILEAAARDSHDVLAQPAPYALFTGSTDGNLNFRLCAWIDRYEDESRIASGVRRAIHKRFEEYGIKLPDPFGNFAQQIANTTSSSAESFTGNT